MTADCPLCAVRAVQQERLEREVLELRLALAESRPTTEARRDLEAVNLRLAEANQEIAQLKARLHNRRSKAS